MGFTKKSWLALVLAIVMVLGMAMPTAFAALPTPVQVDLGFSVDGATATKPTATIATMKFAEEKTIEFSNQANTAEPLTEKWLGQKPVVTIDGVDPSLLQVTVGDGLIKVKSVGISSAATSFTVKIEPQADKTFQPTAVNWSGTNYYFFGTVTVSTITPLITYTGGPISLDTQDVSGVLNAVILNTDKFSVQPTTAKLTFSVAPVKDAARLDDKGDVTIAAMTANKSYSMTAKTPGELQVVATMLGDGIAPVPATISIPVHVGNSTADAPYKLVSDKTSFSLARNANPSDFTAMISIEDYKGTKLWPLATNKFVPVAGNFVASMITKPNDVVLTNGPILSNREIPLTAGTHYTLDQSNGKFVFNLDAVNSTIKALPGGADIISSKGEIVLGYKADGILASTSIATITAVPLNTGLSNDHLVLDLVQYKPYNAADTTTKLTKNAQFFTLSSSVESGAVKVLSATVANNIYKTSPVASPSLIKNPLPAGVTITPEGVNQFKVEAPYGTKLGTYEIYVWGMITDASGTAPGTYPTELKKITVEIKDTTAVPVLTATPDKVALDIVATSPKHSQAIALAYTNALTSDPKIDITAATDITWDPALAGAITPISLSADKKTLTLTAVSRYKGVMTIKGKVDGVAFDPVKVNVEVADMTPGKPDHFVATPDTLKVKINETPNIKLAVVDYDGNPLETTYIGTYTPSYSTAGIVTATQHLNAGTKTNQINVVPVLPGKTTLTLKEARIAGTHEGLSIDIPIEVEAMTMTSDKTSIALDLKDDPCKTTIKLTADTGSSITWPALSFDPAALAANFTVTPDGKGSYEVVAKTGVNAPPRTNVAKIKFTGGKVDGYPAQDISIPLAIANSSAITVDKSEITFEMKDGGMKQTTLTVKSNPAGSVATPFVVSSFVSSDTKVVTIEKSGTPTNDTTTFIVKAVGKGVAQIALNGNVGSKTLPETVVSINVVESDDLPVITSTPAGPIALSVKEGGHKEEVLAFTSTKGTLSDITCVIADTTVASVSTSAPWKVTALKQGSTTLTVNAKANGVACKPLTIVINVDTAIATTDFLLDNEAATPTSLTYGAAGFNEHTLTVLENGTPVAGEVTWKSTDKDVIGMAAASQASQTLKTTSTVKILVKKAGTSTITAKTATKTYSIKFTVKSASLQGFDAPVVPASLVVGQKVCAFPSLNPKNARTSGFYFTSDNKSVAIVSAKGTVKAVAAGTAQIKIKAKSSKVSPRTKYVTITVVNNYDNVKFNSIMLLQDNGALKNSDAAALKTILSSAKYISTATANATNDLPAASTAIEVKNAITAMAIASGDNDVNTFYFAGNATKSGLQLGGNTTMTFSELAEALTACKGNVIVYLDCKGSSRMINTKAASDADIFTAFSKAAHSGLYAAGKVGRPKFTVFTATEKASRDIKLANSTATDFSNKFTAAFVAALRIDVAGATMAADADKDGLVTVSEIYKALKAGNAYTRTWSSTSGKLPVYAVKN